MEVGIVDGTGAILVRVRTATPVPTTPNDLRRPPPRRRPTCWRRSPVPPTACGVGCGGPMAPAGETVSPLNIPAWRRFPLRARLADLVGVDVAVDNDAKALALGEGWTGAARGAADYLAMVVSTGVGGGVVLDGRLLDGAGGNAGHIGHVVVEPDGRPCACGGRGCLEAEASGTAIAAVTGRPAAEADTRRAPAVRDPGGPGRGVGGQPARPAARRGGRVGRPRARGRLLRRRPGGDRRCGAASSSPGPRGSAPAAWGRTVRWSARRPWRAVAPAWWPAPAWWRMVGDESVGPRLATRHTDAPGDVGRTAVGRTPRRVRGPGRGAGTSPSW